MKRLISRLFVDQRVRFLIVGSVNTLVGYVIFAALTQWVFVGVAFGYLISLALSYAIAITMAFFLYRRFVFPVKGRLLQDFVRFVGVYAVTIAINALALPLLVEIVGIPPLIAQALILAVTTCISFIGHRDFSFHRKPSESPDGSVSLPAMPKTPPSNC